MSLAKIMWKLTDSLQQDFENQEIVIIRKDITVEIDEPKFRKRKGA
jgi:hypothetical protein